MAARPLPPGVDPSSEVIREFEYDLILFDALFLLVWLVLLLRGRRLFALSYGAVLGVLFYSIDSRSWFYTQAKGFPPGTMLREYEFTLEDGQVLTRPEPYDALALSNPYVSLKHGADFMMLISYALIYLSWQMLMWQAWGRYKRRPGQLLRAVMPHTLLFFGAFMVIPLLSRLTPIYDARVWTVRHMSGEEEFSNDLIRFKTLFSFALAAPCFLFTDPLALPFAFAVGAWQAFTMEFPLLVYGIRPFSLDVLWHETLYLINQTTATSLVAVDFVLPRCGFRTDPDHLDAEASAGYRLTITAMVVLSMSLMRVTPTYIYWWLDKGAVDAAQAAALAAAWLGMALILKVCSALCASRKAKAKAG